MTVEWDDEIKAFVSKKTGRLVAPRLDEDGIDLFFVENRNDREARARYCSGEGYWAFPFSKEEIEKVLKDYEDIIEVIKKTPEKEILKLLGGD